MKTDDVKLKLNIAMLGGKVIIGIKNANEIGQLGYR